jgi:spermidine synthase
MISGDTMKGFHCLVVGCVVFGLAHSAGAADCRSAFYSNDPTKWAESIYNRMFFYKSEDCVRLTFRLVGTEWNESILNLSDRSELPVPYTRALTVAVAYPDELRHVLMLGVGGGTTLNYLSAYLSDAKLLGVELDSKVLEFTRNDFALSSNTKLEFVESDGRMFLLRTKSKFDMIILDAYRGGYVPSHMLTREFYKLLRTRLTPSGVASINLHGGTALFDSSLKTIQDEFPSVDVYPAEGNVVVVASNRKIERKDVQERGEDRQRSYGFRYPISELLRTRRDFLIPSGTDALTDDFSPANQLEQIKSINAQTRW